MLSIPFVAGSPNWIDLATPDLAGANTFYGGLFGWTFRSAGPQFGGYGMYMQDGKAVGAAMEMPAEQAKPSWSVYFHAVDSEATVKAVEAAGGASMFGPHDVAALGRMSGFTDVTGARFSTWQPEEHKGLDEVNAPGTFCWAELYTTDVPASAAFYRAVFGWDTNSAPYPGGTYTMASPAGTGPEANFAGFVQTGADSPDGCYWLPYFEVDDVDATVARAKQLGGSVVMEPVDLPGVGRLAKATDPYGAQFALIKDADAGA
ncbi:VOC family protein [Streptomyces sp. NBC_01267]|uniref:VOC family protein n=1 Tax=Streptomyces sp. NBC_01267 TaxID=2903805 RepID=UPI002E35477E|nr:VOC family protein [Streptomyces sp. NBC_01267]